jgi:Tat protein secretion system quality control protein TatD with DNase activity
VILIPCVVAAKKPSRQVAIYDFKGDKDLLDKYISLGFHIGLTGSICNPEYAEIFQTFVKVPTTPPSSCPLTLGSVTSVERGGKN